jgi:hypothetical protein
VQSTSPCHGTKHNRHRPHGIMYLVVTSQEVVVKDGKEIDKFDELNHYRLSSVGSFSSK